MVERLPPCGEYGDVDGDGYVTDADAQMVLEYVVDSIDLTPEQLERADVNNDSVVDSSDAALILQYVEGRIDTFPVCKKGIPIEVVVGAAAAICAGIIYWAKSKKL